MRLPETGDSAEGRGWLPRTTARAERSPTAETALVAIAVSAVRIPLSVLGATEVFALALPLRSAPWTVVTSVYAHAGPVHLLGNLFGLLLAGAVVERVTTRARFHAFVLVTGALAGLAEVTLGALLALSPRAVLGASGAVFALAGYVIAGNRVTDRLLGLVDRTTEAPWAVTALLVVVAAVLAILLSGPRTALVGHATGLLAGLLAGRRRLLHVEG